MMQGAAAAKRYVNKYLESDLPSRLITYRNHLQLDEDSLPEPLLYLNYEPVALDHWPTVITMAISTADMSRIDYDWDLNPEYRVRYNMRTYVWVKADGSELCTEIRDNLTMVLRSALLDHPCLEAYANDNGPVIIDEGTMREEFSDLTLIKGDRVLAGAYLSYDITLDETITRQNIGELTEIGLYVGQVGITKSIDEATFKSKGTIL